jgi:predicted transcriptional regulator
MSKSVTMSLVATKELKKMLEQWAQQDDRSVSYIIRQILEKEIRCRAAEAQEQKIIDK